LLSSLCGPLEAAAPPVLPAGANDALAGPIPLGSTRPDPSGSCLFFGSAPGFGFVFPDESNFEVRVGSAPAVVYRWAPFERECERWSVQVGSHPGLCGECYLGHGFSVGGTLTWRPAVRLVWYPAEFVSFTWEAGLGWVGCYAGVAL